MAFLLHQLLTESAERVPNQNAVVGAECTLTYSELDVLSNQIANQLRADGVRAGDRVGIFLPKSTYSVAALFGIQKAGAAYVPIDPNSPSKRAAYILRNCDISALVTNSEKLAVLPQDFFDSGSIRSVLLAQGNPRIPECPREGMHFTSWEQMLTNSTANPNVAVTDNDLAYILYTSGSTGEPKGVMISHLNSLTFVNWCFDEFGVTASDKVSSHAPFHFDLSIFDIFCTIKAGATIYLVPNETHAFPVQLAKWIADQGLTIWYSVPSALIQLLERGRLDNHDYSRLRTVLFAGEVFPLKYLRKLMEAIPHPAYYNLYGPTETNVCTYYKVAESDVAADRTDPVPIGKACANTDVVALNDEGKPVGAGDQGELYVRSSTVMKGYWGRPDSTAKVVLPNLLNKNFSDVMYKTGDIVQRMADGNYHYVGRRDKMIKSRGYRIELGEIEAALYSHPEVSEAAAIAVADEKIGARIIAYIVSSNGLDQKQLRSYCRDRLPEYMIPEKFEIRQQLPKTSTGKIDKTTLEQQEVR